MVSCLFFLAMALNAEALTSPSEAPALDIIHAEPAQRTDAQQIATLIAQQYAAWNAHNLDGYMACFWHSPQLVYAVQEGVWMGWDDVRAHLQRDYPDKNAMGQVVLERLQTTLVDAGVATTVEWWTDYFPSVRVRGFTISGWRKLPEGWRVVEGSSSAVETP